MLLLATVVPLGLLGLLTVPVRLRFEARGLDPLRGQAHVSWLFGLVAFQLRAPASDKAAREPPRKRVAGRRARRERTELVAMLRNADFRRRGLQLVRDLLAAARLNDAFLHLRLGLDDPAATGRLWALAGPLNAAASRLRAIDVRVEPEFLEPALDFHTAGRLRIIPLQLISLLTIFVLSPSVRRSWRAARG